MLIAEADDPTTPFDRLAVLASYESRAVREAVARRPALPLELVRGLLLDDAWQVRYALIDAAEGDPERQALLAESGDKWVRAILADVPTLSAAVQRRLAADSFSETAERIAKNTQDRELFESMLTDPRPRVRGMCAWNDAMCTLEDARRLAHDRSWVARASVVHRSDLTDDDLMELARDRSGQVQWQFILRQNPTPISVLEAIAEHGDEINARHARAKIDRETVTRELDRDS